MVRVRVWGGREDGQDLIEYGLIVGFLALASVAAVGAVRVTVPWVSRYLSVSMDGSTPALEPESTADAEPVAAADTDPHPADAVPASDDGEGAGIGVGDTPVAPGPGRDADDPSPRAGRD